jgi:hypothetical protein
MSIEAHPNIQAVAVNVDILTSIERNLRGKGLKKKERILSDEKIKNLIINFMVDISTRIDEIVE